MVSVAAIFCIALAGAADAAQGDGVTLLQTASGPGEDVSAETAKPAALASGSASEFIAVSGAALVGTEKVASEMTSAVEVLQTQVLAMHRDQKLNLEAQDTMYEKKLKAQKMESQVIAATNAVLAENIAALTKENKDKRGGCKQLMEANDGLRANLSTLKNDIVLAMDFVNHSMKGSLSDRNVPELEVLTQLEAADSHSAHTSLGQDAKLAPRLSMLDGGARSHHPEDPAEKLLKGLTQSLQKLEEEGNDGAAKLKGHFMDQYKAAALEQTNLRNTQAQLNTTKASLNHLGARLDVALTHLSSLHKQLQQRVASVLQFTSRMSEPANEATPVQTEGVSSKSTHMTKAQEAGLDALIEETIKETKSSLLETSSSTK